MDKKKKVAFICVHNSCRSQIAEALGKYLADPTGKDDEAFIAVIGQIERKIMDLKDSLS